MKPHTADSAAVRPATHDNVRSRGNERSLTLEVFVAANSLRFVPDAIAAVGA